jgi:hypothetical protein
VQRKCINRHKELGLQRWSSYTIQESYSYFKTSTKYACWGFSYASRRSNVPHRRFEAPTRAEAAAAVLRLVRAHPSHDIVIGVDSLGKGGALRVLKGDRTNNCI